MVVVRSRIAAVRRKADVNELRYAGGIILREKSMRSSSMRGGIGRGLAAAVMMAVAAGSAMSQPAASSGGGAPGSILEGEKPASVVPGLAYDAAFFPGAKYDAAVPTPDSILGYKLGSKAASPAEIDRVVRAIAEKSPRVKVFEYAKSHEGRPLVYAVVATPERIGNLDALKADLAKFDDPRKVSAAEGDALAKSLPLVAWMAYSIHGDEMSGADASLALLYHLAASSDADVADMLGKMVVCIDPLMNPDGRDRCVTGIRQRRTVQPDLDDQSILHSQTWPSGRMNHYLFDMNRDWIFATQPETRGRVMAARDWKPQYFMESHEMGAQDTFLFMPAREPINYNYPEHAHRWAVKIAEDHAKALDAHGWRYYSGEWNESWYPGYSSTWGALRGSIEQLYEQANLQTDAVRRAEGTLQAYREAVHIQLVSSWANLTSLAKNRDGIMADFVAERRKNVSAEGRYSKRVFALPPSKNAGRMEAFLDLLRVQGVEFVRSEGAFSGSGVDRLGKKVEGREFPAGTVLIPTRQPLGNYVAATLEFDPRFKSEFLTEERRELLRFDRSRLYDTTAWNLTMLQDLESYELSMETLPAAKGDEGVRPKADEAPLPALPSGENSPVAWIVDGSDDRSVALAARLMERGVWVRVCNKPIELDGTPYPRGSVVIEAKDNLNLVAAGGVKATPTREETTSTLHGIVSGALKELGLRGAAVSSGMGPGDLPDMGGEHFVLLHQPRVAVLTEAPFSPYSVGEIWFTLDRTLGMRASYVDFEQLGGTDLRRYNVIVVPDGASEEELKGRVDSLRTWVESGGTLVAIGRSAAALAREGGIGSTRRLSDVLTKLDDYRLQVIREWEGRSVEPKLDDVYASTPPKAIEYPWSIDDSKKPSDEEAKRRDAWRKVFAPQGAVLAGRVDDRHWLTSGCGAYLPVLYQGASVLMSAGGVDAPIRLGVFTKAEAAEAVKEPAAPLGVTTDSSNGAPSAAASSTKDDEKAKEPPPPGWTIAPPGYDLTLRMSGLLWPEASAALANAPYVTGEGVGKGQVILFASSPTTRAATTGTIRVFENAVVFGPGMGASQPIRP